MFSPAVVVLQLDFFPFLGGVDSPLVLSVAPFWLKQHVHPDIRLRFTPSLWSMMILLRSETELYISGEYYISGFLFTAMFAGRWTTWI